MPIQIVDENEKFEFGNMERDGYCFYLRRLPSPVRNKIMNDYTTMDKRGREHLNAGAAGDAMLKYCILGWKKNSVINKDGKPVGYNEELVPYLPEDIQVKVLDKVGADVADLRGWDKNNSKSGDESKN